jgi:hypothetical protein
MRRRLALGLVAVVAFAAPAPARADSARPTNYRSTVTELQPATDAVVVEVRGGDAFISIEQRRQVEIVVFGYQGEPYVRIDPSGSVSVNTNSPAYHLNDDRYARVTVPKDVSADAEPKWLQVGDDGRYGWHDHRTHWMAPNPPPGVNQSVDSLIQEWIVPIQVGGVPTNVLGTLVWEPTISPFPWFLVVAVIGSMLSWLAVRGSVMVAMGLGTLLSLLVGIAQVIESPLGPVGELFAWVPGVVALIITGATISRGPGIMTVGTSAVILGIWAGLRLTTLTMPVLPTALPPLLERFSVSVVMASVLAMGYWVLAELRPGGASARA